jgi:hypothetical protein
LGWDHNLGIDSTPIKNTNWIMKKNITWKWKKCWCQKCCRCCYKEIKGLLVLLMLLHENYRIIGAIANEWKEWYCC